MKLDDLVNDLLAYCPELTRRFALKQLHKAAKQFFDETGIWKSTEIIHYDGAGRYEVPTPNHTRLHKVIALKNGTADVPFTHLYPSDVEIAFSTEAAELEITISIVPISEAVTIPCDLLTRWDTALTECALYMLKKMTAQPWASKDWSMHFAEYQKFVGEARQAAMLGHSQTQYTIAPRRFG